MIGRVLLGGLLIGAAVVVITSIPDLQRYIRIRDM